MFRGSHVVLVSLRGLPTVVNTTSLDYPDMIRSGNYSIMNSAGTGSVTPGHEELMTKRDAEELKETLLQACLDENE